MKKSKTLKLILTITLIMLLSMIGVQVNAATINDEKDNIRFPMIISNGSGRLTVDEGTAVYYQAVEVSEETYNKLVSLSEEGKEKTDALYAEANAILDEANAILDEANAILDELKIIDAEGKELQSKCDELEKEYQAKLAEYEAMQDGDDKEKYNKDILTPSAKAVEDKRAELGAKADKYIEKSDEYEAKFDKYEEKFDKYEEKFAEYKAEYKEYQDAITAVRESVEYNDSKWIQTTDNSFTVDIDTYAGVKTYAIWAKVETAQGVVYDMAIYKVSGTYEEEEKTEENTQPEQPAQPEEQLPEAEQVINQEQPAQEESTEEEPIEQTETNNAGQTTNTKSSQVTTNNPKTGDHIGIAFAVLAFVVVLNIVLTIKSKKTEK